MYVTETDYIVIDCDALKLLQSSDSARRIAAERAAQQQISGYLNGRYDMTTEFEKTGDDRNAIIVQIYCDIVLYTLVSALPGRMGSEVRKERYDNAIKWLSASKNLMLSLPLYTDSATGETDSENPIRWNSWEKQKNDW